MKHACWQRTVASVALVLCVAALGGCGPIARVTAAFWAGTLFGMLLPSGQPVRLVVERTCYQDGQIVDCAALNLDAGP